MSMDNSTTVQPYDGGCHCGKFKFTIKVPEIRSATSCNCSFCSKIAALWIVLPAVDSLTVESGGDGLVVYQFGNKKLEHKV
jgi:hypothetical protein